MVLFPEPLRPITQTTSRGAMSTEIFFNTCRRPKYLSRSEIFTIDISTIPPRKTGLNYTLQVRKHDGHHPVKNRRHDQRFQVPKLGASNFCGSPHNLMDKPG